MTGYAQTPRQDGQGDRHTRRPGCSGINWSTVPALNSFTLAAGPRQLGRTKSPIDKRSADAAKLHVGDQTTVLSTGVPRPATIVGITRFGDVDTPGALSVVIFDSVTAQDVLNGPGQLDAIAVTARKGVAPAVLVARLAPVVGGGNEVITGPALVKERQDKVGKDISQFGTFLTMFALIALFVGAFIINNTFSIIVSQRTKEMALLRAVRASGRQVRGAVLAEAAVTGLAASGIGLVARAGRGERAAVAARARSAWTSRLARWSSPRPRPSSRLRSGL